LVEVDGVQFDNAAIASTYYDANNDLGGATNLNLTDIDGNSLFSERVLLRISLPNQ
jgi:hypothetical protein